MICLLHINTSAASIDLYIQIQELLLWTGKFTIPSFIYKLRIWIFLMRKYISNGSWMSTHSQILKKLFTHCSIILITPGRFKQINLDIVIVFLIKHKCFGLVFRRPHELALSYLPFWPLIFLFIHLVFEPHWLLVFLPLFLKNSYLYHIYIYKS